MKIQTSIGGNILAWNHCIHWRFLAWMTNRGVVILDTQETKVQEFSFEPGHGEYILVVSQHGETAHLYRHPAGCWTLYRHPAGWRDLDRVFGVQLCSDTGLRYIKGDVPPAGANSYEGPFELDGTLPNALLYGRELVRYLRWKQSPECLPLYDLKGNLQIPEGKEHIDTIDVHPYNITKIVRDHGLEEAYRAAPGELAYRLAPLHGEFRYPSWSWKSDLNLNGLWTRLGGRLLRDGSPFAARDPAMGMLRTWGPSDSGRATSPEDARGFFWVVGDESGKLVLERLERTS